VVAIAVTLLILPLVEVVTESQAEGLSAQEMISDNWPQLLSFLLSFAVISRFWLTHHAIFEHVKAYDPRLMQLNILWLLCIVVLPFPTEIVGVYASTKFIAALYIGTLLALSICQLGLMLLIRNHKELEDEANPISPRLVSGAYIFTGLSLVAFLLAAFVPGVKFYALLLLILTAFDGVVQRFSRRSAQKA
jgi:uncharacterized membrane protein